MKQTSLDATLMDRASQLVTRDPAVASAAHASAVVIIEPNFTGHRWRYAQWIAEACIEAGDPCIVVTDVANEDHRFAREIAAARRPGLDIAFVNAEDERHQHGAGRISYVRFHRYFHRAYRLLREVQRIRLVVVPYVDYFLYALPLLGTPFGHTPWVGITMRSTFHHHKVGVRTPGRPLADTVKAQLFRRAARTKGLQTLLSIDPTLPDWCDHALHGRGAAIRYLADPFPDVTIENPLIARQRLGLRDDTRYVLVYGSITERKGIYELIEGLGRMDEPPCLIIAGEQDDDVRRFVRARAPFMSPPPIVLDSFISNELERDLFSACDAVWLGYRGHYGMSGVLVQAYRFGKPVIATGDGLIGWFSEEGRLGPILTDLKPDTIARALRELSGQWRDGMPARADTTPSLLARNTLSGFKETFQQVLH